MNSDDTQSRRADFVKEKIQEVEGLKWRQIWNLIKAINLLPDDNSLDGRFIYTLKI